MAEDSQRLPAEVDATRRIQDNSPPQRARLFILWWDRFIADVAHNETSARLLVKRHLKAWLKSTDRLPLRFYLVPRVKQDASSVRSLGEIISDKLSAGEISAEPFPVIPDLW
jgi:hypothetical protein